MALWSPDDPYGIGILRKVLLALAPGALLLGVYRVLVRDHGFEYYAIASVAFLIVGLFLEKALDTLSRRSRE